MMPESDCLPKLDCCPCQSNFIMIQSPEWLQFRATGKENIIAKEIIYFN